MNKKFKVLQISGFSGMLILGAVIFCLLAGFIGFPIMLVTLGWNSLLAGTIGAPTMNYLQGALLWSIIWLSLYISSRNKFCIKMATEEDIIKNEEFLKILSDKQKTPQEITKSIQKELIKDLINNEEEIKKWKK